MSEEVLAYAVVDTRTDKPIVAVLKHPGDLRGKNLKIVPLVAQKEE